MNIKHEMALFHFVVSNNIARKRKGIVIKYTNYIVSIAQKWDTKHVWFLLRIGLKL